LPFKIVHVLSCHPVFSADANIQSRTSVLIQQMSISHTFPMTMNVMAEYVTVFAECNRL